MKQLITLTMLLSYQILMGSSQTKEQPQSHIYLNISFIKAGENYETYYLEKAIYEAKQFVGKIFSQQGIHFVYDRTTELIEEPSAIQKKWELGNLPVLDDRLIIYVFPADSSSNHQYPFSTYPGESVIVPFYNQQEFNHFVAKNIAYMLGLKMHPLIGSDIYVDANITQQEIAQHLETTYHKLTSTPVDHGWRKPEEVQLKISGAWFPEINVYITDEQAALIRKSIDTMVQLRNKQYRIDLPANQEIPTITADL